MKYLFLIVTILSLSSSIFSQKLLTEIPIEQRNITKLKGIPNPDGTLCITYQETKIQKKLNAPAAPPNSSFYYQYKNYYYHYFKVYDQDFNEINKGKMNSVRVVPFKIIKGGTYQLFYENRTFIREVFIDNSQNRFRHKTHPFNAKGEVYLGFLQSDKRNYAISLNKKENTLNFYQFLDNFKTEKKTFTLNHPKYNIDWKLYDFIIGNSKNASPIELMKNNPNKIYIKKNENILVTCKPQNADSNHLIFEINWELGEIVRTKIIADDEIINSSNPTPNKILELSDEARQKGSAFIAKKGKEYRKAIQEYFFLATENGLCVIFFNKKGKKIEIWNLQ